METKNKKNRFFCLWSSNRCKCNRPTVDFLLLFFWSRPPHFIQKKTFYSNTGNRNTQTQTHARQKTKTKTQKRAETQNTDTNTHADTTPARINANATSVCPEYAAKCSGCHPSPSARCTSAPVCVCVCFVCANRTSSIEVGFPSTTTKNTAGRTEKKKNRN